MAKYDQVDRLMEQAARPAGPKVNRPTETGGRNAEAVLEEQVAAGERSVPGAAAVTPQPATPAAALGERHVSPAERGRQLLGAIRPFLPVVGGALRMVDHGAVQAIARMLPALGVVGAVRTADVPGAATAPTVAALEKSQEELRRDLGDCQQELTGQGEKLRKLRESLERSVAEQGSLNLQANQLSRRVRLLSSVLGVLALCVVVELVLLLILYRR